MQLSPIEVRSSSPIIGLQQQQQQQPYHRRQPEQM